MDLGKYAAAKTDEIFARTKKAISKAQNELSSRGMLTSGPGGTKATEVAIETLQVEARSVLEDLHTIGLSYSEESVWQSVWSQGLERMHTDLLEYLKDQVYEGRGVLSDHISGEVDRSLRQCQEDLSLFIAGIESTEREKTSSWKRDLILILAESRGVVEKRRPLDLS